MIKYLNLETCTEPVEIDGRTRYAKHNPFMYKTKTLAEKWQPCDAFILKAKRLMGKGVRFTLIDHLFREKFRYLEDQGNYELYWSFWSKTFRHINGLIKC